MKFAEFSLSPNLLRSIAEAGFKECTEVQAETLAYTLSGKDVLVQSQTGTGKTAAFLISLFYLMEKNGGYHQALIIVPTRELAVQIEAEAHLLSRYLNFSITAVFGGVGYIQQENSLRSGIDVLIGTPGRLIDLNHKRLLNLKQYNYLVIDEADRLFDMGFFGDIRKILKKMPRRNNRQTMLFSATLSFGVKKLASDYMHDQEEIHIQTETITVHTINQKLYHVNSSEKLKLLIGILGKYSFSQALIFTNTKQMCEELAERLRFNGYTIQYLTGDLPQRKRLKRINQFKRGDLPIMVATDVAARGLHIDDLELVINYDLPQHCENYVHRIGRTARAGKSGTAVSLACDRMVENLAPIEKFIKMKIPSAVPEEALFADDKSVDKYLSRRKKERQLKKRSEHSYKKRKKKFKKDTYTHLSSLKSELSLGKKRKRNPQQAKKINAPYPPQTQTDNSGQEKPRVKPEKQEIHGFISKLISNFKNRWL